jgi:hypothetical protein
MLASDAPILTLASKVPRFWHLRIDREDFSKPEYYIGQTVFHKMKVKHGEILHPVTVIGLWWSGWDWTYCIQLPEDHPEFVYEDHEWHEVEAHQLEPM